MRHSFISVAACASLTVALFMGQAQAGSKYDKTIEQAAIDIAVQKLGEIRGSHAVNEPHSLYPPMGARTADNGLLKPDDRQDRPVIAPASLQTN